MAGVIVEILFMLFSVYSAALWAKMSEYEAYWLTGFLLIKSSACSRSNYCNLF